MLIKKDVSQIVYKRFCNKVDIKKYRGNSLYKKCFYHNTKEKFVNVKTPINMVKEKGAKDVTWCEIPIRHHDLIKGNTLANKIKEFVPVNRSFTTHMRIRYSNNQFISVGTQFGSVYKSPDDLNIVQSTARQKITHTLARYLIDQDDIDFVTARICLTSPAFIEEFSISDNVKKKTSKSEDLACESKNLNVDFDDNFSITDEPLKSDILGPLLNYLKKNDSNRKQTIESSMLNISKAKKALKIPVANEFVVEPIKLKTESDNGYITHIFIKPEYGDTNFLLNIRERANLSPNQSDKILDFTDDFVFYYPVDNSGVHYILAVQKASNDVITKIKYSLSGVMIERIVDTPIYHNKDMKLISRSYNQSKDTMLLDVIKGKILKKVTYLSIPPIKKSKGLTARVNTNIGCIDLETFQDDDGMWKVYACGFKTVLNNKPVTFYIDDKKNYKDIVLNMIDELLKSKYNHIKFYCHNLAGYDVVFILYVLLEHNEITIQNKYDIKLTFKDSKILKLSIAKIDHTNSVKKINRLTIKDSYSILPSSLQKLGEDFEVSTPKSKFPYEFVTNNTLFYIGETPSISFYKDITQEEYNKLYTEDWSLKKNTLQYLENDLNCLLEVLSKANRQIYRDYNIDMTSKLTISGLALELFLSSYYPKNVIPLINNKKMLNDLQKAYFGGITEVYRPHGFNLYYYDVNSLYPSVAFNDMPGLDCYKIDFHEKPDINSEEFFGFFYCDIETPKTGYIAVLPFRDNGVHYRLGNWSGWYFSEELKFAASLGYNINPKKGYMFSREKNVFDDYINHVYKIKSTTYNKTQKTIAKSMLNNLLGRFGINIDKPITRILNVKDFNEYSTMYRIDSFKEITQDKYLVTYYPYLDKSLIEQHKLDIVKIAKKYPDKESANTGSASIVISSAINAYARIHMSKLKLDIINKKKGEIYYSDTDSLVTNIELDKTFVHPFNLGKLKLEHKIKEGIFISGKTYCLVTNDKVIIRAKGFNSSSLNYDDFIKLLNKNNVNATKTISSKHWDKGYVSIETIDAIINALSSEKRSRIYKNDIWVDTKPIYQ